MPKRFNTNGSPTKKGLRQNKKNKGKHCANVEGSSTCTNNNNYKYNGNSGRDPLMQGSDAILMDLDYGNGPDNNGECNVDSECNFTVDGECNVEEEKRRWKVGEKVDALWNKKWYKCVVAEEKLNKNGFYYTLEFEEDRTM